MDRFIAQMTAHRDADLAICYGDGVAWQYNRDQVMVYDDSYWNKCAEYIDSEIAIKINAARVGLVERHYGGGLVLDIGIGAGEFIEKRAATGAVTHGADVNATAIAWLAQKGLLAQYGIEYRAVTMWDVLEHVPCPESYLRKIPEWGWLFVSIPVFDNLEQIRKSRHYRPGEHLYYFTEWGFEQWARKHGFCVIEKNDAEVLAGREGIKTYALQKVWRAQ